MVTQNKIINSIFTTIKIYIGVILFCILAGALVTYIETLSDVTLGWIAFGLVTIVITIINYAES